jgi:hypothetical protein
MKFVEEVGIKIKRFLSCKGMAKDSFSNNDKAQKLLNEVIQKYKQKAKEEMQNER